nr:unnamed protein product [Callosobruchus analis]
MKIKKPSMDDDQYVHRKCFMDKICPRCKDIEQLINVYRCRPIASSTFRR